MKQVLNITILTILSLALSNCASRYRNINPAQQQFSRSGVKGSIDMSWQPNVLVSSHNKKYVKKGNKKGMQVIAIRIKNNTNKPIQLGRDFSLADGSNDIQAVTTEEALGILKQQPLYYLGYLGLGIPNITYSFNAQFGSETNSGSGRSRIPGLIAGTVLAGTNYFVANNANKKFKDELQLHNLVGREIRPGDIYFGLVVYRGTSTASNMTLKIIK